MLAAILELAERQHGVVSRAQLRALGLSSQAINRLFASSAWEALSPRVVRRAGSPPTLRQQLMAAVLDVGGDAALAYFTSANRWGLRGCSVRPITVVTTRAGVTSELCRIRRLRHLPERWCCVLDGLPIVRPEFQALQLFAVCSDPRAERLVDRLWSMRLLSGPSITRFLDEMGAQGRNGTAGLRRYLEARGPGYVPPASGLESRFAQLMEDAGIPMRRQVDLGGEQWSGRVDFLHSWLPVVVEVQSEAFHTALVDERADAARRRRLEEDGFQVVEVTDVEVWTQPAVVVARVRAAIAAAAVVL